MLAAAGVSCLSLIATSLISCRHTGCLGKAIKVREKSLKQTQEEEIVPVLGRNLPKEVIFQKNGGGKRQILISFARWMYVISSLHPHRGVYTSSLRQEKVRLMI